MTNASKSGLVRDLAVFSLLRLGVVVVLTAAIVAIGKVTIEIPLLVAALFAVVIALPLSMVLFAPLRRRINERIAEVDEARRTQKQELRSRLSGGND